MVLKGEHDFRVLLGFNFLEKLKMIRFLENFKFLGNCWREGSCPSSFPSGNQVDGSPLVAIGGQKNVDLFVISGAFLFKLIRSFIMRCYHWYFSRKVQLKRKLGSYSAIQLLEQSELASTREIWLNLMIFVIFMFLFRKIFLFLKLNILNALKFGRACRLDESSRWKPGWRFTAAFEFI